MSNDYTVALTDKQHRALVFAAQQQWIHDSAAVMKEVQALVHNWTYGEDAERTMFLIRQKTANLGEYPSG